MNMNPEFKRNLWQEFSVQRLVAMPIILLAIFFIAYKQNINSVSSVGFTLITLLLVVWGSGSAADAIFQEIRDHTWDALRMTPLKPWSMAWGKLFGSTSFVWYGTLWCLIAILFASVKVQSNSQELVFQIFYNLLMGLFAQTFALFTALCFQRISPTHTRARTVFIQLFAIIVTSILFWIGNLRNPSFFDNWYHLHFSPETLVIGSLLFFCGSLLFGIYRLLCSELQLRTYPWGWPVFLILWIFYLWGFSLGFPETAQTGVSFSIGFSNLFSLKMNTNEALRSIVNDRALFTGVAFIVLLKGTYLSAFFTPKSIVHYFRWIKYLKENKLKHAISLTPSWVFTALLALIMLFFLILFLNQLQESDEMKLSMMGLSVSSFLFLIRDLGILYFLTFNFHAKRAHLAFIVYLVVLYALLPMLFSMFNLSFWVPALNPGAWFTQTEHATLLQFIVITIVIALEGLLAWGSVALRWKNETTIFS